MNQAGNTTSGSKAFASREKAAEDQYIRQKVKQIYTDSAVKRLTLNLGARTNQSFESFFRRQKTRN